MKTSFIIPPLAVLSILISFGCSNTGQGDQKAYLNAGRANVAANAAFTDAWRNLDGARIAMGDAFGIKQAIIDSGHTVSDALMRMYGPDTTLSYMGPLGEANQANADTKQAYEGAVRGLRDTWKVFAETGRSEDLRAVADARQAQAEAAQAYANTRQSIADIVQALKQYRDSLRQSEEFAVREAAYEAREDSMRAVQATQAEARVRQRDSLRAVQAEAQAERQRQAATTATAEELDKAYDDNPVAADQKYKGETWTVIGTVNMIEPEYINLKGDGFIDLGINCKFTARSHDRVAQIQDDDLIRVRGIVKGQEGFGFIVIEPCRVL